MFKNSSFNHFRNTILIPDLLISFYSVFYFVNFSILRKTGFFQVFLFSFKPILFIFLYSLSERNDNIKLIFLWSLFLCSLQYLYIKNMKSTIRIMANINLLFHTKKPLMVLFCWNISYIMNKNSLFRLAKTVANTWSTSKMYYYSYI